MLEMFALVIQLKLETMRQAAYIAELESRPPIVQVEYRVEYIDRVVTETVTERVEVPTVEAVEVPAESAECGVCGAHVTDWWTVRNDADTANVNVCELCYLRISKDDYEWPWNA